MLLLALLLTAPQPTPQPQTTWYVDATATAPGLGTQSQPYARIDFCVAQPTTLSGDVVSVAPGDYVDEAVDYGGRDLVIESTGGAAVTFISGLGVGSTLHPLVRFEQGETRAAELKGFTVRNAPGSQPTIGAAVLCTGSSPTISDCRFEGNLSPARGSAVFYQGGSPLIQNCAFEGNGGEGAINGQGGDGELDNVEFLDSAAPIWGGIVCDQGTLLVRNSNFQPSDSGYGDSRAAMHIFALGAEVHVEDSTFDGAPLSGLGGRGIFLDNCITFLTNCTFDGYATDTLAGAALLGSGGDLSADASNFTNCSTAQGVGGAVALVGCRAAFTQCQFTGNRADEGGTTGGAIYKWGFENLLVDTCLFLSNVAGDGGAVGVAFGPCFIELSGFLGNRAERPMVGSTEVRGGAVYSAGPAVLEKNYFASNQALADAAGSPATEAAGGAVYFGAFAAVSSCVFENNLCRATTQAQGGAVWGNASTTFERCQFKRNRAEFVPGMGGLAEGGAVAGDAGNLVANSSFVDNVAGTAGQTTHNADLSHCIVKNPGASPVYGAAFVEFSIIPGGYAGTGNLDVDPLYWGANDLNLLPGSPAIDAGDPNLPADPDGSPLDIGAIPHDAFHCGPGCEGVLSTVLCNSNINSAGTEGKLQVIGSSSVADNLVILASEALPIGVPGYFLMATELDFVPLFGGSEGNLCLGTSIFRLNQSVQFVNAGGVVSRTLDLTDLPPNAVVMAGSDWHFQFWHRDFNGVNNTSNTTHSGSVSFQ